MRRGCDGHGERSKGPERSRCAGEGRDTAETGGGRGDMILRCFPILRCRQIPKFSCRPTAETTAVAIFPPPQAFLAHSARFVPILCAVKQI